MKIQKHLYPALLAGALLLPAAAMAATETANLGVSIKINGVCTLSAATLAFAEQNNGLDIANNVDATATVTVNCTNTTVYRLGFDAGQQYDQGSRRIADGKGNFIKYDIYDEDGRTNALTAIGGSTTLSRTADGSNQELTVFGRVPIQTATAVGSYADQVVMTLDY